MLVQVIPRISLSDFRDPISNSKCTSEMQPLGDVADMRTGKRMADTVL